MTTIIKYLYGAEGGSLHIVDGESDVTSAGGIARFKNPDAKIWEYIDKTAAELGVIAPSSQWNKALVEKVNDALDKLKVVELVTEFYDEYLKNAKLGILPTHAKVAMMSMYTNSPARAWKAVQQTIIDMGRSGSIKVTTANIGKVDGMAGSRTVKALQAITLKSMNDDSFGRYFEALILSNMKSQYITLALKNPDKYMKYLRGWNNRMDHLNRI